MLFCGVFFWCNMQEDFLLCIWRGSRTSYCWLLVGFCFNVSCGPDSSKQAWGNALELQDKKRVCIFLRVYLQSIFHFFLYVAAFVCN